MIFCKPVLAGFPGPAFAAFLAVALGRSVLVPLLRTLVAVVPALTGFSPLAFDLTACAFFTTAGWVLSLLLATAFFFVDGSLLPATVAGVFFTAGNDLPVVFSMANVEGFGLLM